MKRYVLKTNVLFIVLILITMGCKQGKNSPNEQRSIIRIDTTRLTYLLPSPIKVGKMTVEEALQNRRSHRYYQDRAISASDLSQILWAAYGITMPRHDYAFLRGGLRTAPSAGARYPLEIYVLAGKVKGIEQGLYKYIPEGRKLIRTTDKDMRSDLCASALNQAMIKEAPAVLLFCAVFERTTERYGNRGRERYVYMDLGHSAENVYLQAEALHMGTCAIGAFNDDQVKAAMNLPEEEEPLYIMPFGYYFSKVEF